MKKATAVLFDFDGVITNTEPQYDIYFDRLGEKYNLGYQSFASMIKGTTMPYVLKTFLNHLPEEDIKIIKEEVEEFEKQMDFPPIPGSIEFVHYLKNNGYKIGLVTSSQDFKMKIALEKLELTGVFDTEVTADRITEGKPNPMCYLLGAEDLGVQPEECIVFEDSFHGINAGVNAGMRVIGISSTISDSELKKLVENVIPDFSNKQELIGFLG